jgi:uncharacterized protein YukE
MTSSSAIPANYDSSTLNIDPGGLSSEAQLVLASVQDIANDLVTIATTLQNLTLSWTGASATAASKYGTEWTDATKALFGTKSDPTSGALQVLVNGLGSAAQNYAQNEANVASTFNKFYKAFSSSPPAGNSSHGTSSSQAAGKPVTDKPADAVNGVYMYHTTSVNES